MEAYTVFFTWRNLNRISIVRAIKRRTLLWRNWRNMQHWYATMARGSWREGEAMQTIFLTFVYYNLTINPVVWSEHTKALAHVACRSAFCCLLVKWLIWKPSLRLWNRQHWKKDTMHVAMFYSLVSNCVLKTDGPVPEQFHPGLRNNKENEFYLDVSVNVGIYAVSKPPASIKLENTIWWRSLPIVLKGIRNVFTCFSSSQSMTLCFWSCTPKIHSLGRFSQTMGNFVALVLATDFPRYT